MKKTVIAGVVLALAASLASAQDLTPAQALMRSLHKELVEINTVTERGDTLIAAEAMAARLRAAGFAAGDVQVLSSGPRKGNLIARYRGTGAKRPMLLVAHTDVVEAKREDWSSDPFKYEIRDGYVYGRGVSDDKFMAAAFVTNLIRFKQEGFKPDRDLILVLETDEENLDANELGMRWLLKHHRDKLGDAEFALNEGGGIGLRQGKPVRITIQTSEKMSVSYRLETKNNGGHSSVPSRDNAIYNLAAGLQKLAQFDFPLQMSETTRGFFAGSAAFESGTQAADMRAVAAPTPDAAAAARMSTQPVYNAQLRTTCVATTMEGGHAYNALPQVARAVVNCRILPGVPVESVQQALVQVMGDERISVTPITAVTVSPPSPLEPQLMSAIARVSSEMWPGIVIVPTMSAGATDGAYLRNAGIPTYGHSGHGVEIGENRAHGKDERLSLKVIDEGQEYLYRLVKALSKPQ